MKDNIIDGRKIAERIISSIKKEVSAFPNKPCLAVILVGDNPASKVYINMKMIKCGEVGINSENYSLPSDVSEEELLTLINKLNQDRNVNGILVQLPLPRHINEFEIFKAIDTKKDVDCFHPLNTGLLYEKKSQFEPCTPKGILEMIKSTGYEIKGKHAVVVGRSKIVGNPVAQLLLQHDATVTICHSNTTNLKKYTTQADILIAAVGQPKLIKRDMVKEGALIIDVGVNKISDEPKTKEYYLCGDVDFDNVKDQSLFISPVPGGVGPMTIAMLMKNTVTAYKLQNDRW